MAPAREASGIVPVQYPSGLPANNPNDLNPIHRVIHSLWITATFGPVILLLACVDPTLPTEDDTSVVESSWLVEAEDETEVLPAFPEVDFFSDDVVLPVEIDLSSSSRTALRNNPRDYAPVDLIVGGNRLEVGIRFKGSSTTQSIDSKPSLKVRFDFVHPEQRFMGLRRINLHNLTLDPILSSEWLMWGIWRAAELPAPRVGYARLDINGDDRGLYTVVEDIEDDFLQRWYEDSDGNLYENAENYCDFTHVGCFDADEDDEGNDDALRALIDAAALNGAAWNSAMKERMDWELWTGFMAMERTVAHWDSYSFDLSNYRVYHEPTQDAWSFIPWSGDLGFGYRPWSYPDCGKHGVDPADHDMGMLSSGCKADAECRDDVLDKMLVYADLIESLGGSTLVEQALTRVRDEAETDPEHKWAMDHFDEHGACVAAFVDQRPDWVRDWVAANR